TLVLKEDFRVEHGIAEFGEKRIGKGLTKSQWRSILGIQDADVAILDDRLHRIGVDGIEDVQQELWMKSGREDPRLCAIFALDGDDTAAGERASAVDTEDLRQMVIGNIDVGGREYAERN